MKKLSQFYFSLSGPKGLVEGLQGQFTANPETFRENCLKLFEAPRIMPFFYAFFIFLTAVSLGQVTDKLLQTPQVSVEYKSAGLPHVYGPVPRAEEKKNHYEFYRAYFTEGSFSGRIPLDRISEVSKEQLKGLMLQAVPRNIRQRLGVFIPLALGFAEKYQVDPFWAVAIMWTESHFNPHAESYVDAQGLMQILPGTGEYLFKLMNRPVSGINDQMVKDPHLNMEMGVFYLKRLLNRFDGNYVHATVSYNMGPTRIKRRLYSGLPVGEDNLYLDKVTRAYRKLTRPFKREVLSAPRPFVKTLAAYPHYRQGRDHLFGLYSLQGFLHRVPLASQYVPSTPYPARDARRSESSAQKVAVTQ